MARITILGMSGSGKSWYAGAMLEKIVPKFDLAVHFDLENEETGLSDANSDPLYQTLRVGRERYDGDEQINWIKTIYRHRKLRVVPEGLVGDEARDLYGRICEAVMLLCKDLPKLDMPDGAFVPSSAFVSCDEAHNLVPQARKIDERVERMITGGRKHGVECLHISQRPQLVHNTVITQADRRVYFGISGDRDIAAINKQCVFNAKKLKKIGERQCIVENKDSGDTETIDTNTVDRIRPHHSGDDGLADDALPV